MRTLFLSALVLSASACGADGSGAGDDGAVAMGDGSAVADGAVRDGALADLSSLNPVPDGGGPMPYKCAPTIHVATNGKDSNDGSASAPLLTIAAAAKKATAPGTCIAVHPGSYHEVASSGFATDGTDAAPIVLYSSDDGGKPNPLGATIDADNYAVDTPIINISADHIIVDGFVIQHMSTQLQDQPIHFDGLQKHKGAGGVVRRCKISGGWDQLKVNQAASGITVENNEFFGEFGHIGISITGVVGMTLRGNYFHDWASGDNGSIQIKGGSSLVLVDGNLFANITGAAGVVALGDGCDATCDIDPDHFACVDSAVTNNVMLNVPRLVDFGGAKSCAAVNNTAVGSATQTVAFKLIPATTNGTMKECTDAHIENNIVYAMSGGLADIVQIGGGVDNNSAASATNLVMDYNLFWNGGSAISYGQNHPNSADAHSMTMDPKFVNPGGTTPADFKVLPGSPAIDKGANLGAGNGHDYDGVSRPQGAGFDIGAFEQ
jgi:hypothetical protein